MRLSSKVFLTLSVCVWMYTLPSAQAAVKRAPAPPRLTVVVVVDQLRGDELSIYQKEWRAGLKQFTHEGRWFSKAVHGHGRTETAAGHACIGTGLHPKHHGVVNKTFYDQDAHKVFAVCSMGPTPCEPLASYEPSIGDRLKQHYPGAKVVALSQKDRAAVLPAGRNPDLVAWFAKDTNRMVGRTQGKPGVPAWLDEAYAARANLSRVKKTWELPLDLPASLRSRPDQSEGEGDCGHGVVFPHRVPETLSGEALYSAWKCTPDSNDALKDIALRVVDEMHLGQDSTPDLLWVSFSSVDIIGHSYGAESLERAAALWDLDAQLGALLEGLRKRVPDVKVALTADHGVTFRAETLKAKGIPYARRVPESELYEHLLAGMKATCGTENPVEAFVTPFVTLKKGMACGKHAGLAKKVASVLARHPDIYKAWTFEMLKKDKDPVALMMLENWHPKRSGDVVFVLKEHLSMGDSDRGNTGANHGMPWWDDLHVPVVLWGQGVKAAEITQSVRVIDLMRSVADLLGLPVDRRGGKPLP